MLGIVLLYVAIVLMQNGICRLYNIDGRSSAIMNIFVGGLSIILNICVIVYAELHQDKSSFYVAGTGLLFGFTYLFIALNSIYKLDLRPFGWYSLFVAINAIPAAYFSYDPTSPSIEGILFPVIWIAWGVLWLTGFIECVLKIELKFVPYLAILEGIFTAWIPAWLIFSGIWQ